MDFYIGKILDNLKEMGEEENTIIFYYDNKKDPYQFHRIKGSEMDSQLEKALKAELVRQLVAVDDTWAQKRICGEYVNY